MTVVVEPVAARRREWPAWAVPPRALGEWLRLVEALQSAGEPWCSNDPDRWFSTVPAEVEEAVAACAACPVLAECRAYVLAADERTGTWGGLSELERRAMAGRSR